MGVSNGDSAANSNDDMSPRASDVGALNSTPTDSVNKRELQGDRLAFIDGFRGIAILLVIGFHYFSHFAHDARGIYPYGDFLANVPIFKYGFYGVQLFFVVSGFVIAMTLRRTSNLREFVVRRFARLWPTMLICCTVTYIVLWQWPMFWPQRPINFLPSLAFVDGALLGYVHPALESRWIDGAYWSLFVEVRFYFYASIIYFAAPQKFARNMTGFSIVAVVMYAISLSFNHELSVVINLALISEHLPWFLGGLAAYQFWRGDVKGSVISGIVSLGLLGWLANLNVQGASLIVALCVAAMMGACLCSTLARNVFANRAISAVGVASYSLYLLHQNLGLTLISALSDTAEMDGPASIVIAIIVAAALILFSLAIYRFWELPINRLIVRVLARSEPNRWTQVSATSSPK